MNSTKLRDSGGVAVLLALVALSFVGRFLPGASTWGFHYHAYLPAVFTAVWLGLAVLLFLPVSQRKFGGLLGGGGPRFVFSAIGPIALAAVFAVLFALLSERSFFMGDGYLVGELVEKGMPFRSFDNMDYLLHFQLYKALRNPMDPTAVSSFEIYRWGAVVAGILGVLIIGFLAGLLRWAPWQRLLVVGLFLFSGPAASFYGYVESYGFLLVFMSAFLLSGVLVLDGRLPLWVASLFFGLAAFMHLTAAFGAPALLFLALFAPVRPLTRRWLEAAGPALIVFSISILVHVKTGYDQNFFKREFIEAQNTKSLWVPLTGPHGFLSVEHWRDLLNLAFLSLPVPLAILLLRIRSVFAGVRDRTVQFLLVHTAFLAIFVLFIDRKLGGARDWDLFAAHGFGLVLLAVWALGTRAGRAEAPALPDSRRTKRGPFPVDDSVPGLARAALPAAILLSVPWILLLHRESDSIERFTDVAAGFARFPRAYAYEELGKYYRKTEDSEQALRMYELCVETYPSNGRFQVLLGSMYMRKYSELTDEEEKKVYLEKAEASYREGARLQESDPNPITLINLGRCLSVQGRWEEAVEAHGQASQLDPSNAENWVNLGHALLQARRLEDAIGAYRNALGLDPTLAIRRQLGAALLATSHPEEAAEVFREGLRRGEEKRVLSYGLAASLVAQADRARDRGEAPPLEKMAEAEEILRGLLQADPGDSDARGVYERLRGLMNQG